ncbi:MAG: glycosyltransferase family 1 protein, partial [Alphaproteobacteria bacterium]
MTAEPVRIAFYAPMKPPDHPTPSGDRRMARALMTVLAADGHDVVLAARLRAFDGSGDATRQAAIRVRAERAAKRLIAAWRHDSGRRPDLWFTYHVHHKAPDWIGPRVAGALGIPYVVAEASHAPKRQVGPWAIGYAGALAAICAADAVLVLTDDDRAGIRRVVPARRIVPLPPFLDPLPFASARPQRARLARRHGLDPDAPWLLTVAMMRPGDKTLSYQRLGQALARLGDVPWQLVVVGDGAAAGTCRRALRSPDRAR